jgi:signal transduction histidine kinase
MLRLPLTTRGRLTLAAGAVLGVALVLADVGTYFLLTYTASQLVDKQLQDQAEQVAPHLQFVDGRVSYRGSALPEETPDGVAVDLAVVGNTGVLVATPNPPFSARTLEDFARPALRSGHVVRLETAIGGEARRIYVEPLAPRLDQELALIAATSLVESRTSAAQALAIAVSVSVLLLAIGVILVHSLLGRALQPVQRIARLADTLSERDLHRRVEVRTPNDELGELVKTFNRMLARLESSFDTLRGFTADASHELRSPLALMRTELEVSLAKPVSKEEYQRVLRQLSAEVQHMTGVVERLLLLARADAGQLRPRRERLDVADFLHEAYGRWLTRAAERGLELQLSAPDSGTMQADLDLTRRIIDNLVENALRHSPRGAQVLLSAARDGEGWRFDVADQGPGVPETERVRIFDRFARVDPARTPDAEGGTGLGLPLSAAFARVQGGELRLAPARPGWSAVFELWLPDSASLV